MILYIEQYAIVNGQLYTAIAKDASIPEIDGEKFILKIHGDFKNRNIVLKEEDYLNYSEHFKIMETFVKSIFATNTVVFIGYGLGDYSVDTDSSHVTIKGSDLTQAQKNDDNRRILHNRLDQKVADS